MALRVGILPHADFPHLVPCFRLARELIKCGHDVRVLGSDVETVGRGHSEAWSNLLALYGLGGREVVHRGGEAGFCDWLISQMRELHLDVIVLDAVWQGLAFACDDRGVVGSVVVHHAGLPDFRTGDMPTWVFVHPRHSRDAWMRARKFIEQLEQGGRGFRGNLSAIKALSAAGRKRTGAYEFGCVEFAGLPAIRAMSLCPAAEFPGERGRVDYFGTLLPKPGDVDWRPPSPELTDSSETLIACAFGTTGLQTAAEYEWLYSVAKRLARAFTDCQVLVVIPDWANSTRGDDDLPKNLLCQSWVPLWEILAIWRGAKILVSMPGVGTFREAVASGTPIVAIPRRTDQFGAAARVEYFNVGSVLDSAQLPGPELVVERVGRVLEDQGIHEQARRLRAEFDAFDATLPLKRFFENPIRGATGIG